MKTLLGEFDYQRPSSVPEALKLLGQYGKEAHIIAGGTDLMIQMAEKTSRPAVLIDVNEIPELNGISLKDNMLRIGATTTFAALAHSSSIKEMVPALHAASASMGNPQIRNRGTIGGNLSNGSPAADSATPLLAYDSRLVLAGQAGDREVLIQDFFLSGGKTALSSDEILKEIQIPVKDSTVRPCSFIKLGKRKAACLSVVSVAVALNHQHNVCDMARIALGAVAPIPMRAVAAEDALNGGPLTQEAIERAANIAADETDPISDIRASREYRQEMCRVLVRRGIQQALAS
jgi:carbon-monoxide dehydrogenase medium subunit